MTTLKPVVEIAARLAAAARVDALLRATAGDPLADPEVVAALAGWLAAGVSIREVDVVVAATPRAVALAEATARALGIPPGGRVASAAGARVLVVDLDHGDDAAFEAAIGVAEAAGARVVGAAAVREAASGRPRLVAPGTGRIVPLRTLTRAGVN